MNYRGYHGGRLELDDDGCFLGYVLGVNAVITFKGRTAPEIEHAFRESVDDYLAWCAERRVKPDKPHSGKFQVRLDPNLHRKVVAASEAKNMSMNAWVARALEKEANRELD
ncbi:MAG: type II toxin-antitoxin system HicB family antitoxin [Proteobacteria bacterium]|nr:type II toxin-antitoxin system HicB family antitoxin [Pseudomonadota bacterium]MDA1058118.1 type II toxin-antitoxin system HicB family antitoxin [Pseudomonadota bacterium]